MNVIWQTTLAIIVIMVVMAIIRKTTNKCDHKWETLDYQVVNVWGNSGQKYPTSRTSHLSQACEKCGTPRVLKLDGIWDPNRQAKLS